jgi:type III pantothenate kinase
MTHNWEKVCMRAFGVEALVVTVNRCREMLGIGEDEFAELGADRVADAVGAKHVYGCPCIVVDLGTATNIEVVDKDGVFRGGVIAPGVETSMRTLITRAALLRAVEIEDPGVIVGRNTTEAIQVGVAIGEACRIDGLVERIQEYLGYPATVVATGGLSYRLEPMSRTFDAVNLELTLQGLRIIYDELSK